MESLLPDNIFKAGLYGSSVAEVLTGSAPAESVVWSRPAALDRVLWNRPEVVVILTSRAISSRMLSALQRHGVRVVVDLVDPLSASYEQRATIYGGIRRLAFASLARNSARVEKSLTAVGEVLVAAGRTDAERLGATWLPILASGVQNDFHPSSTKQWDALFVGSLDYAPNVDAVERLAEEIWPRVRAAKPHSVLAVAGRRPTSRVVRATRAPGIHMVGPFHDLAEIAADARLALSPLRVSTGFQIKVLDAAEMKLPQIVSPASLRGFSPGFPARVEEDNERFAGAIVELIQNREAASRLADDALSHVAECYGISKWKGTAAELLGLPRAP